MTDDVAARKTYRYARLGMIGAVVLLAAAVLIEVIDAPGCWQTSISAYYYTPARGVFVGALMAVGLSLIVIKGSTTAEDICLNAAGMLAPVVALLPTSGAGSCWSIEPDPLPTVKIGDDIQLQDWVVRNIDNNSKALLIAGTFGLITATVVAFAAMKFRRPADEATTLGQAITRNKGTVLSLAVTGAAIVGFAAWREISPEVFDERAHGLSAVVMFGFLAGAAFANAWDAKSHKRLAYARIYAAVGSAMVLTAGIFVVPERRLLHKVLWIEVLEIIWFLVLWIVQSRELWHNTLRPRVHEDVPRITVPDGGDVPFEVVVFDRRGRCTSTTTRDRLLEWASSGAFTDVFVFSHGWNNDYPTALHRYREFIEGYQAFRRDNDLAMPDGYRPLLVGIHWPSAILTWDYEDAPAPAAELGAPLSEADEEALGVLEAELADAARAGALRALATANSAPDEALAAFLAPLFTGTDEVGARAPTVEDLLATWQTTTGRFGGDGQFSRIRRHDAVAAPAGIFATARDVIRQATAWLMKDRAGRVGAHGVGPLLSDLQHAATRAKIHLIGHSYGCKVLLSAIALEEVEPVESVLLLQAAVNHRCFAANRGDGRPGGYAVTLGKVVQPIVTTYSAHDVALRKVFHWLNRTACRSGGAGGSRSGSA